MMAKLVAVLAATCLDIRDPCRRCDPGQLAFLLVFRSQLPGVYLADLSPGRQPPC